MTDFWTSKDTLWIVIDIGFGFLISYFAALFFEYISNRRKIKILLNKYGFLQSGENVFDWQHWNINEGKIEAYPIDSYMTLKYDGQKNFSFKWKTKSGEEILGDGFIFWDNLTHGRMSFYEYEKEWFDYRNVFHKEILHQNVRYNAIYVNADDQNTKYVMLRVV